MRRLFRFLLLLLLAVGLAPAVPAQAQCTLSPLPAGCAANTVFRAFAAGVEVQSLCVGQPVTLLPGTCRGTVQLSLVFYQAQPTSAGVLNVACTNFPPDAASAGGNVYTPTAAGIVTISELTNPDASGGTPTLYSRNFQVFSAGTPYFLVSPCQGGTAQFHTTSTEYDQYVVQVDGTTVATVAPIVTISIPASPGSTVTVQGIHSGNPTCTNSYSKVVPALVAAGAPELKQLTASQPLPGQLLATLGGLVTGYTYEVQRADAGGFVTVGTAQSNGGGSEAQLTLSVPGPGQYRVRQLNACQNVVAATPAAPTVELMGTSANNVNVLSWRAGGPVSGYTLLRDGAVLATLPATSTGTYEDRAVSCGTSYTYELQSRNAGTLSVGGPVVVRAVSTLAPPAPLLNASFDLANRLILRATLPGGAALPAGSAVTYSRQGGPDNVDFASVPAATDTLPDPAPLADLLAAPPCYTATLQNLCGNRSAPSAPVCPVLLTAEPADPDGRTARLSWTAFRGPGSPAAPVSYRVLTLAPDGTVLAASAATTALTYLDGSPPADRQVLRYRVEASGAGLPAGQLSYSNVASVTRRPLVAIPNAFTPNGDGLNDVLEVKGRYLAAFTFVVVDRNGQEVFRATDRSQTWDGTIQGHAPVNAPYVWRFTMTDEAGQAFSQTGTVSVLK